MDLLWCVIQWRKYQSNKINPTLWKNFFKKLQRKNSCLVLQHMNRQKLTIIRQSHNQKIPRPNQIIWTKKGSKPWPIFKTKIGFNFYNCLCDYKCRYQLSYEITSVLETQSCLEYIYATSIDCFRGFVLDAVSQQKIVTQMSQTSCHNPTRRNKSFIHTLTHSCTLALIYEHT